MASKKNVQKNYVVAVKDYEKTMEAIANGSMYVQTFKDEYPAILNNALSKVTGFKEIKKFIKLSKQNKKDVRHYWESLLSNGYTLFLVNYEKEAPTIENLFNSNTLKFICRVI